MIYRHFKGDKLSLLGFGCMRLPVINGNDADIDEDKASEMIAAAISGGINYFDTAYGYHSGNSEIVVGRILSKYPRESFYLASKFPGYDINNLSKVEEIFERQLEKTGAGYFDYYLFHNVCEMNIDGYLEPKNQIMDYLLKQKKNGRIRHLGFSAHGNLDVMKRFIDAYGSEIEFGQIQLNWLDWLFQNAKAKVELLTKHNIPVWVMEPIRGGKLAELSADDKKALAALRENISPVEWAFDFVKSIPGVSMILSGMSNLEQVQDNLRIFSENNALSERETEAILEISRRMSSGIPCTACRYCLEHCPQKINIPEMIRLYNEHVFSGGGFIAPMALVAIDESRRPSACLTCRSCEAVCPQKIKISDVMKDFTERLK